MVKLNATEFANQKEFQTHVDEQKLSRKDLQKMYDGIKGAKPVKRLRNRPYAIERIWEESNRLALLEPKQPTVTHLRTTKATVRDTETVTKAIIDEVHKGTTIAGLITLTESLGKRWKHHTMRGYLSTLKKKGRLSFETSKNGRETHYTARIK